MKYPNNLLKNLRIKLKNKDQFKKHKKQDKYNIRWIDTFDE